MNRPVSSWLARRAAVAAEAHAEDCAAQDAYVAKQRAELEEKSDDEILKELGLPNPDNLKLGDDFKAFMTKTVPEHLRKRALRKLWRSNPVLACVDGLNDYDDDYLTGSTGQGAIKTGYQVGKGMLSHLLEIDRQKSAPAQEADDAADAQTVAEDDVLIENVEPAVESAAVDDIAPKDTVPSAPRRMQFQFEDDSV